MRRRKNLVGFKMGFTWAPDAGNGAVCETAFARRIASPWHRASSYGTLGGKKGGDLLGPAPCLEMVRRLGGYGRGLVRFVPSVC